MALTRVRALQISNIDYKQAVRVITTTNIANLGGGAPDQVDGVNLNVNDRILVNGQSTGSQNGIYYVVSVGTGSTGVWARTVDGNDTGDIQAGMIVMVTEGTTYADSQWKLLTNNPIVIGTTPLNFQQASAFAFGNVYANGTAILADTVGDTLTLTSGNNVVITGNATSDTVTFEVTQTPVFTGNLTAANLITGGLITATGNVTGGNFLTSGLVSVTGTITGANITGANLLTAGLVSATGNVTGGNVNTGGQVSASANITGANLLTGGIVSATSTITGGNIATGGTVSASANITGANLLTGGLISATGLITGGNISTAGQVTSNTIQTTGNAIIGGNLIVNGNVTYINITDLNVQDPIISMGRGPNNTPLTTNDGKDRGEQLWYYKGSENSAFIGWLNASNVLVAATSASVSNNSVTINEYGTFVAGNIQGQTVSLSANITGGNILTGGLISSTGNLTSGNVNTGGQVSASANITGANLLTGGLISATGTISSSSNIAGANLLTGGLISATGNIISAANVSGVTFKGNVEGTYASLSANVTGGNLLTGGIISATGNISGSANLIISGYETVTGNITGGNLLTAGLISSTGNLTSGNVLTAGVVSAGANITGANLLTAGVVSAGANITGANLLTSGLISSTGNLTSGNLLTGGLISATGNLTAGNISTAIINSSSTISAAGTITGGNIATGGTVSASANITGANLLTGGIVSATSTITGGNIATGGTVSATGNISTGANLLVSGYESVTGNVTGGNILTGGLISSTGNLTSGNLLTGGLISATGNISTGANLLVSGYESVAGNVTGGNLLTAGVVSAGANITGANLLTGGLISATGNISTGANLLVSGYESVTGNVTGGNILTGGLISATATITGGNIATGGTVSATGLITGGNISTTGAVITGTLSTTGNALVGGNLIVNGNVTYVNVSELDVQDPIIALGRGANNTPLATDDGKDRGEQLWYYKGSENSAFIGWQNSSNVLIAATSASVANNVVTVNDYGTFQAGNIKGTTASLTANVTGGNILTGGLISSTGNITGGNITTNGQANLGNIRISGDNITDTNGRVNFNTALGDVDFSVNGTVANVFYIDAGINTAAFGNANAYNGAIVNFDTTNSIIVPIGNTSQRPTATTGMLRFNNEIVQFEGYDGTEWGAIGGTEFTVIADEQFTGDGSTVLYVLSTEQTTNSCIVSINGIVQIPVDAYSVTGNALTFTEAPEAGDQIDIREITTTKTVTALTNATGNAQISTVDTASQINVTGNLIPTANLTYNLGSPTNFWKSLYVGGNSIYLGSLILKDAGANTFAVYTSDGTTQANLDVGTIDVSSITSGTSVIGISGTGGNAYMTIGGTANVLVTATTGVYVTGLVSATGDVIGQNVNSLSDATLKTNVQKIENAEEVINAIDGYTFDWVDGSGSSYGFIAQLIEAILPHAVKTDPVTGVKSVNYSAVIPFLVEMVKKQGQEIAEIKKQLGK